MKIRYKDLITGFTRKKTGKRFSYFDEKGHRICSTKITGRLQKLAVPPAYRNVIYAKDPSAHVQAVGWDARGRKQYRYHPDWITKQDEEKYARMLAFGKTLPKIRKAASRHLNADGFPKEKVLAAMVLLLEKTLIRVGNDEYTKQNDSHGLTTIKNHHVKVSGARIHFKFKGKSHVQRDVEIVDATLAKVVDKCKRMPGREVFEYVDEKGKYRRLRSTDVNQYLKQIGGQEFTAKDFRTWAGTVMACRELNKLTAFETITEGKRNINLVVTQVSQKLGNTKAVCRKSYIQPEVLQFYLNGKLERALKKFS